MRKGFTIAEVMIAVSTVGLLVAIAIPSFIKAKDKADLDKKISRAMANGDTNVVRVVNEEKYKPEFLFEYDGVKIYRFFDDKDASGNRYHYFSREVR